MTEILLAFSMIFNVALVVVMARRSRGCARHIAALKRHLADSDHLAEARLRDLRNTTSELKQADELVARHAAKIDKLTADLGNASRQLSAVREVLCT